MNNNDVIDNAKTSLCVSLDCNQSPIPMLNAWWMHMAKYIDCAKCVCLPTCFYRSYNLFVSLFEDCKNGAILKSTFAVFKFC